MSTLKPCPLCKRKAAPNTEWVGTHLRAYGLREDLPDIEHSNPGCLVCRFRAPYKHWQALPRPSEVVREVVGDMGDALKGCGKTVSYHKVQQWQSRLKATAEPGLVEVWVRWPSGVHKGNLYVVTIIEETIRLGDLPGYCWVRVPVHGTPIAQDAGKCDDCPLHEEAQRLRKYTRERDEFEQRALRAEKNGRLAGDTIDRLRDELGRWEQQGDKYCCSYHESGGTPGESCGGDQAPRLPRSDVAECAGTVHSLSQLEIRGDEIVCPKCSPPQDTAGDETCADCTLKQVCVTYKRGEGVLYGGVECCDYKAPPTPELPPVTDGQSLLRPSDEAVLEIAECLECTAVGYSEAHSDAHLVEVHAYWLKDIAARLKATVGSVAQDVGGDANPSADCKVGGFEAVRKWQESDHFTNQWEHKVAELHYLHPSDLIRLIQDYEKEGWQVATSIERPGCAPLLVFKRPKPLAELHPIPGALAPDVFEKEEA